MLRLHESHTAPYGMTTATATARMPREQATAALARRLAHLTGRYMLVVVSETPERVTLALRPGGPVAVTLMLR